MNWKPHNGTAATARTGGELHLHQPRLGVSDVGPGPGDGLLGRRLGAPCVHQGLFDRLGGGLHSLAVVPGPLGVQQQPLRLADVVLGALQDGVHVGEAANALLDLVGQVPDLDRRGGDGELQHPIGHGFDAVGVGSLLCGAGGGTNKFQ